ncbi:MAG: C45 family peptidase [Methanoregula sp.]|nr:C45 family peptidase [Methanoregula sp.]
MKILGVILGLALLVSAAGALQLPTISDLSGLNNPDLKAISAFENGQRYKAGPYDVVVLSGSYREMGRQYGSLMKDELRSVYTIVTNRTAQQGATIEQVREMGRTATALQPKRMKEIQAGIAETSGLSEEDVQVLYYGAVFYLYGPPSCSFLATWGDYTADGSVIVSRNWDLPDSVSVFDPYYVLVVYKPTDGSNGVATLGPAGMRPETLMNSAGLFIADNNGIASGGDLSYANRPDLISEFFRFMLDYSTMNQLDAGIQTTRTNLAWIVNVAGPEQAYSYEETVFDVKRREGSGMVAASNHFVDPTWHLTGTPDANSVTRFTNLVNQAGQSKGTIDAAKMVQIRNVLLQNGGATFLHYELGGDKYSTDHQVVFVPKTRTLHMKVVDRDWQKVDLKALFGA